MFIDDIKSLYEIAKTIYDQVELAQDNQELAEELGQHIEAVMKRVSIIAALPHLPDYIEETLDNMVDCFKDCQTFIVKYTNPAQKPLSAFAHQARHCKETIRHIVMAGRDCEKFKKLSADLNHFCNELSRCIDTHQLEQSYKIQQAADSRHQEMIDLIQSLTLQVAKPKKSTLACYQLPDTATLQEYYAKITHAFVEPPNARFVSLSDEVPCARKKYKPRFERIESRLQSVSIHHDQYENIRDLLSRLWALIAESNKQAHDSTLPFQIQFEEHLSILEVKLALNQLRQDQMIASYFDEAEKMVKCGRLDVAFNYYLEAINDPNTRGKSAYKLGKFYQVGESQAGNPVKKDYVEALKWYGVAAKERVFDALLRLAEIYTRGHPKGGLEADLNEAQALVNELREIAVTPEEYKKVTMISQLVERKLNQQLAHQGDVNAMYVVATMFYQRKGLKPPANEIEAKAYLQEAKRYAMDAHRKGHRGAAELLLQMEGHYVSTYGDSMII